MSKVKSIILTILLVASILYGLFLTVIVMAAVGSYSDLSAEHDELTEKYNEVFADYKDLYSRYTEAIKDDLSVPVVIRGIAKSIDENSVVTTFDERVVHIIVSYSADINDRVKEYYAMIPSALRTSEYESLIISVVDETGKCVYGWTILSNGDNYPFVGE